MATLAEQKLNDTDNWKKWAGRKAKTVGQTALMYTMLGPIAPFIAAGTLAKGALGLREGKSVRQFELEGRKFAQGNALYEFPIDVAGIRASFRTQEASTNWEKVELGTLNDSEKAQMVSALQKAEQAAAAESELASHFDCLCDVIHAASSSQHIKPATIAAALKADQPEFSNGIEQAYEKSAEVFRDTLVKQLKSQPGTTTADGDLKPAFDKVVKEQEKAFEERQNREKAANDAAYQNLEETIRRFEQANELRLRLIGTANSTVRDRLLEKNKDGNLAIDSNSKGIVPDELMDFTVNQAFQAQDIKGVLFQIDQNGRGSLTMGPGVSTADRQKAMRTLAHFQANKWFEVVGEDNDPEVQKKREACLIKTFNRSNATDLEAARRGLRNDIREYLCTLLDDGVPRDQLPKYMPVNINGKPVQNMDGTPVQVEVPDPDNPGKTKMVNGFSTEEILSDTVGLGLAARTWNQSIGNAAAMVGMDQKYKTPQEKAMANSQGEGEIRKNEYAERVDLGKSSDSRFQELQGELKKAREAARTKISPSESGAPVHDTDTKPTTVGGGRMGNS